MYLVAAVIFLIVAIAEEFVFRAFVLKNLKLAFNKYIALLISALLFSI